MTDFIANYLPWVLSILTLHMSFLAGTKSSFTWGLGLIPMNLGLIAIYCQNHRKWKQDQQRTGFGS